MPELSSQVSPAPDPAASRGNRRRCLLRSTLPRALAVDLPISTLGPSGPSEQPLPRVMAAAVARSTGANAALSCLLAPLPYAPVQALALLLWTQRHLCFDGSFETHVEADICLRHRLHGHVCFHGGLLHFT